MPDLLATSSNFGGKTPDWDALIVAALTLVIILIVCYMCIQLYEIHRAKKAAGAAGAASKTPEPFCGGYRSHNLTIGNGRWGDTCSASCAGRTTGNMPSIESPEPFFPCCGSLAVPPPVYQ